MLSMSQTNLTGNIIKIDSTKYSLFDSITTAKIALSLVELDECKEINDSLYSLVHFQDISIETRNYKMLQLEEQTNLYKGISEKQEEIITEKDKQLKKQIRRAKLQKVFSATFGTATGVAALTFLTLYLVK